MYDLSTNPPNPPVQALYWFESWGCLAVGFNKHVASMITGKTEMLPRIISTHSLHTQGCLHTSRAARAAMTALAGTWGLEGDDDLARGVPPADELVRARHLPPARVRPRVSASSRPCRGNKTGTRRTIDHSSRQRFSPTRCAAQHIRGRAGGRRVLWVAVCREGGGDAGQSRA